MLLSMFDMYDTYIFKCVLILSACVKFAWVVIEPPVGPRVIDRRTADISGNTRARRIDQGYECRWDVTWREEGKARRVRVTREGGDLALNPDQVIHLHLEFHLCAYMYVRDHLSLTETDLLHTFAQLTLPWSEYICISSAIFCISGFFPLPPPPPSFFSSPDKRPGIRCPWDLVDSLMENNRVEQFHILIARIEFILFFFFCFFKILLSGVDSFVCFY